jgi:hypothetical protein
MPRVAPAARVAFAIEAIAGLRRLQRGMARLSHRDKNYESNKRALHATIQELRKSVTESGRSVKAHQRRS